MGTLKNRQFFLYDFDCDYLCWSLEENDNFKFEFCTLTQDEHFLPTML